jgi:PilZ domain-containing protein
MPNSKPERRSQDRVTVRVPVSVRSKDGGPEQIAHTRDLSSKGIFFYSDSQIGQGSLLEMVLILPPEITAGEKKWVCCQASVVRVEDRATQDHRRNFGVAAVIERFDIMPEIPE